MKKSKQHKTKIHPTKGYFETTQEEIRKEQLKYQDLNLQYNQIPPSKLKKRRKLLKKIFLHFGKGSYIEAPYYAYFGGENVSFGKHVYAQKNLYMFDDTFITVGDYTQIGPNVTLLAATQAAYPHRKRDDDYDLDYPIEIGRACFLGAGTIVLPNVTIGDNVVVGAGSVVEYDLPDNVIATGIPVKIIGKIGK